MILGITGGICSGKSSVSQIFKNFGIEVIDADFIAKKISEEPKNINEIVKIFGKNVVKNGILKRGKIREIAFSNPEMLEKLNKLLHPQIIKRFEDEKKKHINKLMCFDIPLLFELKLEYLCDKTLVIGIDKELQLERVISRDNCSREIAEKIVASQLSLSEKIDKADFLIMNNGTLEELEEKVTRIYKKIKV